MECNFNRKFNEPKENYVCIATSLFIPKKYIKLTYGEKRNVLDNKMNSFVKNLISIAKKILNDNFPSNYYFRLYYHNSVNHNNKLKQLIKVLHKHPKCQLIEYKCKNNFTNDIHTNFFGTILRFHAMFDDKSPNMKIVALVDADNTIMDKWLNILQKFEKEKEDILSFETLLEAPFYEYDNVKNSDIFFRAGTTIIRKTSVFNIKLWNKYINNMFNNKNFLNEIYYLDFKKYAFSPELEEQSFLTFEYGFDEILLNYMLRKLIAKHDLKYKIFRLLNYRYKSFFINRFNLFLKYNKKHNKVNYDNFINKINIKNTEKKFKQMPFKNVLRLLKNNIDYLKQLYIQESFIYFIKNYEKILLNERTTPQYSEYFKTL